MSSNKNNNLMSFILNYDEIYNNRSFTLLYAFDFTRFTLRSIKQKVEKGKKKKKNSNKQKNKEKQKNKFD